MSWGLSLVAPNLWFDANARARIADDVQHTAQYLQSQHKTPTQIAQELVALITSAPGYTAAVVDNSGKLLAGSAELAADRPLRFPASPPGPPLGLPVRLRRAEYPTLVFAARCTSCTHRRRTG